MFLVGIFAPSNHKKISKGTLQTTAEVLGGRRLKSIVKDNMYEIILGGLERGAWLEDIESVERYAWGIRRNTELADYSRKVRRKEFSMVTLDDSMDSLPKGAVNEGMIDSEMSLVEQPKISWLTLINKQTVNALELRDELQELVDSFNLVSDYLELTYGFNFKEVLLKALSGVKESEKYLLGILEMEGDEEFVHAFFELARYEEFYDYLRSDRTKLSLEGLNI